MGKMKILVEDREHWGGQRALEKIQSLGEEMKSLKGRALGKMESLK